MRKPLFMTLLVVITLFSAWKIMQIKDQKRTSGAVNIAISKANEISDVMVAYRNFYTEYQYLPGDMPDANSKLSACKDSCFNGNGDYKIDEHKIKKITSFQDERVQFWNHLVKASKLSGYSPEGKELEWGKGFPNIGKGAGLHIFSHSGTGGLPGSFKGQDFSEGLYLVFSSDVTGELTSASRHHLTPGQARIIDDILDDKLPLTGSVKAAGDKECIHRVNGTMEYNYKLKDRKCISLYIFLDQKRWN